MKTSNSRWKFSLSVMLPVVAAVIVTVGLAAGFLLWASSRADLRALERQQAVASRLVEMVKSLVARSQSDQVLRYEVADVFVGGKPDKADIDDNFGEDEYETYEHDSVFVLDPQDHVAKAATVTVAPTGEVVLVCAEDHDTILANIEAALAK